MWLCCLNKDNFSSFLIFKPFIFLVLVNWLEPPVKCGIEILRVDILFCSHSHGESIRSFTIKCDVDSSYMLFIILKFLSIDFYRETEICCSTHSCTHWLISVCVLTRDWTCNLPVLGWCSNRATQPGLVLDALYHNEDIWFAKSFYYEQVLIFPQNTFLAYVLIWFTFLSLLLW